MRLKEKITKQDVEYTLSKFRLWERTKDLKLFTDPTIWAYANLIDKQDNPLRLRAYQDLIINDRNRFVQFVAANQIGKTWALCVKGLHHAFFVKNSTVLIGSRAERQSTRVLDEIKSMTRRSPLGFDSTFDEVNNRTELSFTNGSKIVSGPPTESVLGYDSTLLLLDEMAFWENGSYFYNQVFEPRTNETKNWKHDFLTMGQILAVGNPNGQQGIFFDLWKDPRYSHYRFDWLANPSNTKEEWEEAKKRFPSDIFDSVYAATFTSASGGFITKSEWDNSLTNEPLIINPTKTLYLGGDFAGEDTTSRDVDSTVLYGVQLYQQQNSPSIVKLAYQREFPKRVKKAIVYEEIKRLNKEYSVRFGYDKMGVGDSVRNDLIDKNILSQSQIEVLSYSLPNKSEVYYNLKHIFEQSRLKISNQVNNELREQLLGLRFEKTTAGHMKNPVIMIHHSKEKVHDDHPDAFANACWVALRSESGPVSLTLIKPSKIMKYNKKYECNSCGEIFDNIGRDKCPYCNSIRIGEFR